MSLFRHIPTGGGPDPTYGDSGDSYGIERPAPSNFQQTRDWTAKQKADSNARAKRDAAAQQERINSRDPSKNGIPELDPRIGQIANEQRGAMNEAMQLEDPRDRLMNEALGTTRRDLAEQIKDTRQNASSRGLLYSNLRSDEEAKVTANAAKNFAGRAGQIAAYNPSKAVVDSLEQGLIDTQFNIRNLEQDRYDIIYNERSVREAERNMALGQVGQAAGNIGAYGLDAYANRNNNAGYL